MSQAKRDFQLSSLFFFGQDVDVKAMKVMAEADQTLQRTTAALESSKGKAKGMLEKLDDLRTTLYRDSLKDFFDLYDPSINGLKDIPPNTAQAERFIATFPTFSVTTQFCTPFPALKKVGLVVILGGVWAFILLQILGPISSQQLNALIAIGGALLGLLSAMIFCYRRAQKNLTAAITYFGKVRDFEEGSVRFSSKVEQLAKDFPLAMEALQRKALGLTKQVESLTETVRDAVNAAMLLNKLIGKPLIDGEGALLTDVMRQLEEDVATATMMQNFLGIEDSERGIDVAVA
ncbi:hypothetical protein ACLSSQ_13030 [Azospira sp. APE16]|uniref:hypothetical protein n=1 Tax=Azospira sp. APE16 TaxID=3394231 RepID=UPI003A4E5A5D